MFCLYLGILVYSSIASLPLNSMVTFSPHPIHAGLNATRFLAETRGSTRAKTRQDDRYPRGGTGGDRSLLRSDPCGGDLGSVEEQTRRGGGGHRPQ